MRRHDVGEWPKVYLDRTQWKTYVSKNLLGGKSVYCVGSIRVPVWRSTRSRRRSDGRLGSFIIRRDFQNVRRRSATTPELMLRQ